MKYSVGDKVLYFGTDECEVLNVLPHASHDIWKSDLLVIKFQNGEVKEIAASLVEPSTNQKLSIEDNVLKYGEIANKSKPKNETNDTCPQLIAEINAAADDILNQPKIKSAKNQKMRAYYLFEYIIKNSKYQDSIIQEKTSEDSSLFELEVKDIHRCLCEHRSVCTSDASALSLLFRKAGISSTHITIAEKGQDIKGVHEVVKMDFDGQQYICDPTLTRSALESGNIPDLSPNIFAFTPNDFFAMIYPTKEIKCEYQPILN